MAVASGFVRRFVPVSGLPTKFISIGSPAFDKLSDFPKPEKVILVIPGNPGLCSFYEDFMQSIFEETGRQIPVWAVSHYGHDHPENTGVSVISTETNTVMKVADFKGNEDLFSLQGIIKHKIDFISEYIPANCQITLIGHSIGSKMALDVVKHFESDRKILSYHLFPVFERMKESPNGRFCWIQVVYFFTVCVFLCRLVSMLPRRIIAKVAALKFSHLDPEGCAVQTSVDLASNWRNVEKAFHMAYTEMCELGRVSPSDADLIRRKGSTEMRFYYGTRDGWCPLRYKDEFVRDFPEARVQVCEKGFEHAFVLGSSVEMGKIVAQWLKEDFL